MSLGELLVIILVMVFVFGPKKLPMLARHLGLVVQKIARVQYALSQIWRAYMQEQTFRENLQKAEKVESSKKS